MNFVKIRRDFLLPGAISFALIHQPAFAATILLQPIADTTLIEAVPGNNMGGNEFVNAGTAGPNGGRNRGLYKFDFSSIPPGSKIKSAAVTLEVTGEPGAGGESSSFEFHRMLKDWGEGITVSDPASPGLGLPAGTNEATWNSPFAFTTNSWSGPGASNDFAATISSSTTVYGLADFPHFDSTAQMIADVQGWVNDPTSNFGWMLKSDSENAPHTARRFGSREFVGEDTSSPPNVEVEFVPPPILLSPGVTNQQFAFSFLAEAAQAYTVQFRTNLATTNGWLTFTNVNASAQATNLTVSDALMNGVIRFFRVIPQ